MKTLFHADDGKIQIVLTPETEFEKRLLNEYTSASYRAHIASGTYADCGGGWNRRYACDNSLFVILRDGDK